MPIIIYRRKDVPDSVVALIGDTYRIHAENNRLLKAVNRKLNQLLGDVKTMTTNFDAKLAELEQDITEETDAITAVESTIQTLADEVRAAAGDPARLQAVIDKIVANKSRLAAAAMAGTAADPNAGGGGSAPADGGPAPSA